VDRAADERLVRRGRVVRRRAGEASGPAEPNDATCGTTERKIEDKLGEARQMFHGPWVFQRTSTSPLIQAKLSKYEMNFTKKSVMLANIPMMCRGAENSHAGKGPGMPIRSTSQPQGEMLLAAHLESPLTTNHTLGAASSTTLCGPMCAPCWPPAGVGAAALVRTRLLLLTPPDVAVRG
jgi:hypothetical protein